MNSAINNIIVIEAFILLVFASIDPTAAAYPIIAFCLFVHSFNYLDKTALLKNSVKSMTIEKLNKQISLAILATQAIGIVLAYLVVIKGGIPPSSWGP